MDALTKHTQRSLLLALALGCLAGCADDNRDDPEPPGTQEPEPPSGGGSLCAGCLPRNDVGGEGGSTAADICTSHVALLTAAEAKAHGFDVSALESLAATGIDAPLFWRERAGAASSGFEPDTQVAGEVAIVRYEHIGPDPASCNGTDCAANGSEVPQSLCVGLLEAHIEVRLSTKDNAIEDATLRGTILRHPSASNSSLRGLVRMDLRDANGSLLLEPATGDLESYSGELSVTLEVSATDVRGKVLATLHSGETSTIAIAGYFPEVPSEEGGAAAGTSP